MSNENIRKQFSHLEELIKRIESSGEDYILIGDLNAKIWCKEGIVENNEQNEAGKAIENGASKKGSNSQQNHKMQRKMDLSQYR